MGWTDVMRELEDKVVGTLNGTYRPLDGIPFFRVQYPPQEEREALRQLHLLAERLRQKGWPIREISLTEVLREALTALLGASPEALFEELKSLERERDRRELLRMLSEHLPDALASALIERLRALPKGSGAVLLRTGALHPFLRPSTLLARLEGEVSCAVVLAYPASRVGSFLDMSPVDSRGGYYRGEIIHWR